MSGQSGGSGSGWRKFVLIPVGVILIGLVAFVIYRTITFNNPLPTRVPPGPTIPQTPNSNYTISFTGDAKYTGKCSIFDQDGGEGVSELTGSTGSNTYYSANRISCTFKKESGNGDLSVSLKKSGTEVAKGTTSDPNTVVTVADG